MGGAPKARGACPPSHLLVTPTLGRGIQYIERRRMLGKLRLLRF